MHVIMERNTGHWAGGITDMCLTERLIKGDPEMGRVIQDRTVSLARAKTTL